MPISISQYKTNPPGFKFESYNYDLIHFSYKRYLENKRLLATNSLISNEMVNLLR